MIARTVLYGQSVLDSFLKPPDQQVIYGYSISAGSFYSKIYDSPDTKRKPIHLWFDSSYISANFKNASYTAGIQAEQTGQSFKVGNLYKYNDYFLFTNNYPHANIYGNGKVGFITISGNLGCSKEIDGGSSLSIDMKVCTISGGYKKKKEYPMLNYTVMGIHDTIKLYYQTDTWFGSISSKYFGLYAAETQLSQLENNSLFNLQLTGKTNEVCGFVAYGDLRLDTQLITVKKVNLDVQYETSPFGSLQNLNAFYHDGYVTYQGFQDFKIAIGYAEAELKIGDGSYFQTWPFSFWDLFFPQLTRLDYMDNQCTAVICTCRLSDNFHIIRIGH